jgi:hypothetical protein
MNEPESTHVRQMGIHLGISAAEAGMFFVRYVIGALLIAAGLVVFVVSPADLGVDGFAMAAGGGLAVLMLNGLYRLGVEGDRERDREEQARRYLEEHGEWPADELAPRGRKWTLAPGVVTYEQEQAELAVQPPSLSAGGGR